jgi:RNA-directed DNA polymerase
MMKLLRRHTDFRWIHLYVERWLKASAQLQDGTIIKRNTGTPQGGVISPLLANLFLHYAFDEWMRRNYSSILFERYADDIIVHCRSEKQARWIKAMIEKRLFKVGLELHPEKTKIVYCKDDNRNGSFQNEKFDFLGFTFRPRKSKNRLGKHFISFSPAVSRKAIKNMHQNMQDLHLHRRSDKTLEDTSCIVNPILQGWINYYGSYYKTALYPALQHLDHILVKWAMRKYKKLRGHKRRARNWLRRIAQNEPSLFAHWKSIP